MTHEVLWFVSRATGVVSIVAMTAVFVLGMAVSSRFRRHLEGRTVVMGLHRSLALGMTAFLVAHIVTAIATGWIPGGWLAVVVPFTAGYEDLWMGLGTLAFDVMLAVVITSLLRHRMSQRAWKRVHWLSYALWPLAIVHGLGMSTDSEPVLRAITIGCLALGVLAGLARFVVTPRDTHQRTLVLSQEWS